MLISTGVKIMESKLLCQFVGFLKARWTARSRVDQRRRRLRQLVAMVRAVADAAECSAGERAVRDGSLSAWLHLLRSEALRGQEVLEAPGVDAAAVAGSARHFLAGLKSLLARSAEVDRLTEAVEELELVPLLLPSPSRSPAPSSPSTSISWVARGVGSRRSTFTNDGDDGAGDRLGEGSSSGTSSVAAACAGLGLAVPAGGKRKRGASTSGADGDSASQTEVGNTTVRLPKRRVLASMRSHRSLPAGSGGLFTAPRELPPLPVSRSRRARAVALAMCRIRRRQQRSLGEQLSRISL